MALYVQYFHRSNYSVNPCITQRLPVIIEAADDATDDDIDNAISQAYEQQLASAFSNEFPINAWGGWSSLMHDGDVQKYADPLADISDDEFTLSTGNEIPKVGECGSITFPSGRTKSGGRVDCFFRVYTQADDKASYDNMNAKEKEGYDLHTEIMGDEIPPLNDNYKTGNVLIVRCEREYAQFVSLSGTCGSIVPIELFNVEKLVGWDHRTIMQNRQKKVNVENALKRPTNMDFTRYFEGAK
jgi:hypothetical protein